MSTLPIGSDTPIMQNPDVIFREDEPGGPMLFNPDSNEMRILNSTGLWIWNQCQEKTSLSRLIPDMVVEFDHDGQASSLENDLTLFLQEMISQGFIGLLS